MIREYTDKDCDGVIEAWEAASLIATPFLSPQFMAEEREQIRTVWLQKAETWVYGADERIAGFVSLIGDEVGAIFVHPDYQGRGIGRTLMDHAVGQRDELFLDVFEDNAIGRRFYERYGFRFESRHVHDPTGHAQLRLSCKPNKDG